MLLIFGELVLVNINHQQVALLVSVNPFIVIFVETL